MNCGVGHRCGSDLTLLWLWLRLLVAAPIQLLAWELPYDAGVALLKKKKGKKYTSFFKYILNIYSRIVNLKQMPEELCVFVFCVAVTDDHKFSS